MQVLKTQLQEILDGASGLSQAVERLHKLDDIFYSERFLEPRPLLLIDEIDKADEEFESLLLEILADFAVSLPEIGTLRAKHKPLVLLTSNNTRNLSDALRRRCLHLHIPFPDAALENRIVRSRVPDLPEQLRGQLVNFVHGLRELDLKKPPAISETIDWARSLLLLHAGSLSRELVDDSLNVLLKHEEDLAMARNAMHELLRDAQRG